MPAARNSSRYRFATPTSGEPGSTVSNEPELAARLFHLSRPEQQQPEVEAHGGGLRERARERPEPGERAGGLRLVEQADGRCDPCFGVVRREPCGLRRRRARPNAAYRAAAARRRRRGGRRRCRSARGARAARTAREERASKRRRARSRPGRRSGRLRAKLGMEQIARGDRVGGVGLEGRSRLPGVLRSVPHRPRTARSRGSAARRRSSGEARRAG